jgi:hypothetical protein
VVMGLVPALLAAAPAQWGDGPAHPQCLGWAGTVPYEILTAVSVRVPRIYEG